MSNSAEGEEEEEFYESLDRVLSSSCSSTSSSDDEGDYSCQLRHSRFPLLFPISFDVWLSEPGSVEERRRHLLHQMGLARDPELARANPVGGRSAVGREGKMGRIASCNGLFPLADPAWATPSASAFARSRSDGSVEPRILRRQLSSVTGKPPLVGRSSPSVGGEVEVLDWEGEEAQRCTIKDLGNGKEFVVKEFREDGMWTKLREVGTGRQFSMEEFESCVGSSSLVQDLMRRQNVEDRENGSGASGDRSKDGADSKGGGRSKRGSSWLKSLKNVVAAGQRRDRRSSDEKDTFSEKGGRNSSSVTDDSQDALQSPRHSPEQIKVRQFGKSYKELTGLFLIHEIQAHNGSIWTIKFSLDGRYLASAGEDCVIHAWQVFEHEMKQELLVDQAGQRNGNVNPFPANPNGGSPEEMLLPSRMERCHWEKKKKSAKGPIGIKSLSSVDVMMPERAFALSERPVCSFIGHLDDVLDLSWSKSQYLLSSSMDMTVRLWHLSSNSCLKIFSHSDYVTCIQFNPVDDRYFISGSLDAKVRLWSIPDQKVVDWTDLREIVTAACYRPDGQGALVGSNVGNFHLYDIFDNKLLQKSQIDLQNKKKKSRHNKITGFQFAPGSLSEVLITSADSRIRVIEGSNLVYKFKGFRNTCSQICASPTANGKHVICASEDSNVFIWRYDADERPSRSNSVVNVSQSYEHFHCLGVTVAVPWPNTSLRPEELSPSVDGKEYNLDCISNPNNNSDMVVETSSQYSSLSPGFRYIDLNTRLGLFGDRASATFPEEKLHSSSGKHSRHSSGDLSNGDSVLQSKLAWGMVIVTASRGGVIRVYQNFGLPVRVGPTTWHEPFFSMARPRAANSVSVLVGYMKWWDNCS